MGWCLIKRGENFTIPSIMVFYLLEPCQVDPLSAPEWRVIHQRKNPAYFEKLHGTSELNRFFGTTYAIENEPDRNSTKRIKNKLNSANACYTSV
jgi:hypothetical protein